jgi:hypothetical protein
MCVKCYYCEDHYARCSPTADSFYIWFRIIPGHVPACNQRLNEESIKRLTQGTFNAVRADIHSLCSNDQIHFFVFTGEDNKSLVTRMMCHSCVKDRAERWARAVISKIKFH